MTDVFINTNIIITVSYTLGHHITTNITITVSYTLVHHIRTNITTTVSYTLGHHPRLGLYFAVYVPQPSACTTKHYLQTFQLLSNIALFRNITTSPPFLPPTFV